jgi:hypothetical protein
LKLLDEYDGCLPLRDIFTFSVSVISFYLILNEDETELITKDVLKGYRRDINVNVKIIMIMMRNNVR